MRITVRLWQTALFVTVILMAMAILGTFLLSGIERSIEDLGAAEQVKDASFLAEAVGPHFPITVESLEEIEAETDRFRAIFGDDLWVYDRTGRLIESRATDALPEDLLEEARLEATADSPGYSAVFLREPGVAVAGRAVFGEDGLRAGVVVVAEPTADAEAVLDAARRQMLGVGLVALGVAGFTGLVFSEVISRRVNDLKAAAYAIAQGDFARRLPIGLVPDEVRELAGAFNIMAVQLGEAFDSIQEHDDEMTAVVESMAEGLIALGADGCVRLVNSAAERILRMEAEDLEGGTLAEGVRDDALVKLADRALAGEHSAGTVILGETHVDVLCTPIGPGRRPEGAVVLMRDVTEQKRWERAQREFIANASHEMRTPIAAMNGFLELLGSGAQDDADLRGDFLGTMRLETERISRLVDDLFTLAQFDAGRMTLDLEPESLRDMVEDVTGVMRPIVDEAGVTLATDLADGRLCVLADRDRIVQVLVGFVDNAVKHSSDGDTVTISARVHGPRVDVAVDDEGPGIPAETLPKVLDRFFRASEHREGEWSRHGAGLGLAIAKEIVEAHGSAIEVESTPGEGATFRFSLEATGGCAD